MLAVSSPPTVTDCCPVFADLITDTGFRLCFTTHFHLSVF